jgi:hypothetical protein
LSNQDAKNVLDLFCETGALSASYLKRHRPFAEQMLKDLEVEDGTGFWVHRWIAKGASNDPTGHISAIKIGDNAWLLGDLVGSQDPLEKMPTTFVPGFFRSFQEFSLTIEPCPRHMIMWVDGHPFWEPLLSFSNGEGAGSMYGSARIAYTRLDQMRDAKGGPSVQISRIAASNSSLIRSVQMDLTNRGLLEFASSLDFDPDRYGSPHLRDAFHGANQTFYRVYYVYSCRDSRWLVVLTGLPFGLSLNRIPESAWVFPLSPGIPAQEEWDAITSSIHKVAISTGIKLPSVRRFIPGDGSMKLDGEQAVLRALLCHPNIWDAYRENK